MRVLLPEHFPPRTVKTWQLSLLLQSHVHGQLVNEVIMVRENISYCLTGKVI